MRLAWQVAQQEAQRAQFLVERAIQEKQQKVVQAEGESRAAALVSFPWSLCRCSGCVRRGLLLVLLG